MVILLFGDGANRSKTSSTRIREEDVQTTVLLLDLREELVEVGEDGCVRAHRLYAGPDRFHGLVQLRLASASDIDIRALLCKPLRSGQTDAAAAAGYERDFSFKSA